MTALRLAAPAALFFALLLAPAAFAATCASEDGGGVLNGNCTTSATKFEQTINGFRLLRDNGDSTYTFVVIPVTPTAYDFASVSAGGFLSNLIDGQDIPDGTYVAMSPIIDKMATLNSSVTVDGMSCKTGPSGFVPSSGAGTDYTYDFTAGSGISTSSDGAYDFGSASDTEQWLDSGGDLVIVKKFPSPISSSSNVTLTMVVDAAEAADFHFTAGDCSDVFMGPLGVTFTISAS